MLHFYTIVRINIEDNKNVKSKINYYQNTIIFCKSQVNQLFKVMMLDKTNLSYLPKKILFKKIVNYFQNTIHIM